MRACGCRNAAGASGLVDRNITSDDLIVELDRLAALRGYPAVVRCDNGPELACAAVADWAGARGDQRQEGGQQPPPATLRARLPGPSGLRCSLQPPMNDRCLDPPTVARFVGQVFVSNVGGSWPYGWNRSAVSCGTYVT
jgi:hypothetical protein